LDIDFFPIKPLNDVRESNDFLRRIWARLRADFGLGFQYTPRRQSQSQIQNIGYLSLNRYSEVLLEHGVGDPVACSFLYKRRGIVEKITFSIPESWGACLDINEVGECINSSLSNAMRDAPRNSSYTIGVFTPLHLALPTISGALFHFIGSDGDARLTLNVTHYDEVDLLDQASNLAWSFCVLASAWTGNLFFLQRDQTSMADYRETVSLILDGELNGSVAELAEQSFLELIDLLVSESSVIKTALKAGHLIQRSIFSASSSRDLLGDTANALTISAFEVLSDNGDDPLSCKSCGQPQYKISQRVRDYAAKQMGEDHWRKWFGDQYTVRSKFLHTGAIRHRRVFSGKANPTIQLSAPEGMAMPMGFSFDHVLAYLTLRIFRKHVQSITTPNRLNA
jgi:hypothetical protein